MILFSVILLTQITGIILEETCLGGVCYYFNKIDSSSLATYDDASNQCITKHLKLGIVSQKSIQNEIQNVSKSLSIQEGFYIGLRYRQNEGFIWANGADIVPDLTWSDNLGAISGTMCVFMTAGGDMSMGSCSVKRNFVCSNSSDVVPNKNAMISGFCPAGFFRFLNFCYKMNLKCDDTSYTWEAARAQCAAWTGILVVADSFIEQEFLTALMTVSPQPSWTGLVLRRLAPSVSLWVNNGTSTMPHLPIRFKPGEPNGGHSPQEHCLMVYNRLSNIGFYNDEQCNKSMNFVCKAPVITGSPDPNSNTISVVPHPLFKRGRCRANYYEFNETCYSMENAKKPYVETEIQCDNKVLFVYNDIHIAFIRSLMAFSGVEDVWLSVIDRKTKKINGAMWLVNETSSIENFVPEERKCFYMSTSRGLGTAKSCNDTHIGTSCYYHLSSHEESTANLSCPFLWTKVGIKCLRITEDYINFTDAVSECKNLNGQIATLRNIKEMQAVNSLLHTDAWIGINGPSFLKSSWVDGTKIDYCLFRHTSDLATLVNKDPSGTCFVFRYRKSEWDDKMCHTMYPAVCEAPATENKCNHHLFPINVDGDCYGNVDTEMSWTAAEQYCQANGGKDAHLASFHSLQQEHTVFVQIAGKAEHWIGLKTYDYMMMWIDGSSLNYQRYYVDAPSNNVFNCFSSQKSTDQYFLNSRWSKENCAIKKKFICKISNSARKAVPSTKIPALSKLFCLSGFMRFGNSCFKVINESATWSEANKLCMSKFVSGNSSAKLASFESDAEFAFVLSHLQDVGHQLVWIGLYTDEKSGQLIWIDEKPTTFVKSLDPYQFSKTYHPGNKTAVFVSTNPFQNGHWLQVSKLTHLPYLCRIDPLETLDKSLHSDGKQCHKSQVKYRDFCYLHNEMEMSFQDAQNACQAKGSDLLVIEDTFEEHFVQSLLSDKGAHSGLTWLGVRVDVSLTMMMDWRAVTKRSVYYTHWKNVLRYKNNQFYTDENPKVEIAGCYVLNHTALGFHSDSDRSNIINNNMHNFYCGTRLPSICKTGLKRVVDPEATTCAFSRRGVSYNLDVTKTKHGNPCIRWDLVKTPDAFSFHLYTILYSSVPFNKDGYLSYSLNRCSESDSPDNKTNYSCYTFKDGRYILEECEMQKCSPSLHPESPPRPQRSSSRVALLILFILTIIILSVSLVFLCRQRILSNYRVRSILAHMLGRYQPVWLEDSHRPHTSANGGVGFVNPVYTPLESKY